MNAAELPFGKDLENNIIYVWPYLAEVELDKLTPSQEVDLIRLVGAGGGEAYAGEKEVDVVASDHWRRRHLALLQKGRVRR